MKAQIFSLCILACTACAFDIDDALDQLDSALTISGFHDNFRARLSGTVDLEFYNFQQPAPSLIDSEIDNPFNPVIWGPSYASGISVSGRLGRFDYAVEMKNASLSSRPESWYITENGFE